MFLDDALAAGGKAAAIRESILSTAGLQRRLEVLPPAPSFESALTRGDGPVRVVAEVKRKSPSAGEIMPRAAVGETAAAYEEAGAAAVSVLTSEYGFGGQVSDLSEAREACGLPVLCKDFVSVPYQVLEARAMGASAVLLIAEALDEETLGRLIGQAESLGVAPLVEAHTESGLEKAVEAGASIIGINNRDLNTLEVDLSTTERLYGLVPSGSVVVCESGIRTRSDFDRMASLGVDALLIGEALMRGPEPGRRLSELAGGDVRCG